MQAGTLLDHLGSLHRAALDRLYGDKWTCQAILRALPATSRHYVLRLAGANGMLPVEVVKSWPLQRATALQKHEMILQQLCGLHLLREVVVRQQTHVSMVCYELHASFREQLRQSLCPSWNSEAAEGIGADKHAATAQQLERHAMSTWELLLQAAGCLSFNPPSPSPITLPTPIQPHSPHPRSNPLHPAPTTFLSPIPRNQPPISVRPCPILISMRIRIPVRSDHAGRCAATAEPSQSLSFNVY